MELTVILNQIGGMLATGNYIGVAVFVVIVAFYTIWKKLQKIESTQKKEKPIPDYNRFIESDSVVMDDLDNVRQKFHADRAIVLELRNGEVNVANIPSMKIHVRNEQLRPSVFTISPLINGVPASFYSKPLRKLVKSEVFALEDTEDIKDSDYGLYQNFVSANVKSVYCFPLVDPNGMLYGTFMLEYCFKGRILSEDEIDDLEIDAARLNGEIMVMKKAEDYS